MFNRRCLCFEIGLSDAIPLNSTLKVGRRLVSFIKKSTPAS